MMSTKKRKWKRCLILLASLLIAVTALLVYLTSTRFYFSRAAFPVLARMQWNHPSSSEFHGSRPQIIGHRGSVIAVENARVDLNIGNTATAIRDGIDAGVDWIEIDIRVSKDGQLVVFHDEKLSPKTDGKGKVSDFNLAQLKVLRVMGDPPETILTLDEAFTEFDSEGQKWIFDIKTKGIHQQVLKWIDGKVNSGDLSADELVIFGIYDVLKDYKSADYAMGYTATWSEPGNRMRVLFHPSQIITRCQNLDCDYLVLPVIFASRSLINAAKSKELDVWVYGTDDEIDLKFLAKRGVSGFIVDRPGETMSLFGDKRVRGSSTADDHALDQSR